MKRCIVNIDNSQRIRIPNSLLKQAGLSGQVEIRAEGNNLIIGPARKARVGWAEAFQEMARRGDDALL